MAVAIHSRHITRKLIMARRSRAVIAEELTRIESLIRSHPEGLGLQAVMDAFAAQRDQALPERTMLRRLNTLEVEGRIRSEGKTSAARYFAQQLVTVGDGRAEAAIIAKATATGTATGTAEAEEEYIPLTPDGEVVRALVSQPMVARSPVGYREEFLRDYQPGHTWYLPEPLRLRLHELGRTPDADRPAGTFAHEIFERLLIDLAWASSRLEGNTYTLLDTKNLLKHGVRAEGKAASEAQMLLNHKKAIELLVDHAEDVGFNRYTFLNLHAALAENLMDDPNDEGRVRSRMVGVTGTTYVPLSIPQKTEELFDLFLKQTDAIPDPFEQAFFVMVQLPYLQPFADVNKRTSRLAANIPLIKANLCPLSFLGLPHRAYLEGTLAVYEFNRIELLRDVFVWAYERSCKQYRVVRESMGEPNPIRLRYRTQLAEVVRDTVFSGERPQLDALRGWAKTHEIPDDDRESFAAIALSLIDALHEGSISRYGLRQSEFQAWKKRITTSG